MADSENTTAPTQPTTSILEWVADIGHELFELGYVARAADALLQEDVDGVHTGDGVDRLTGVSYLLGRIARDLERLGKESMDQHDAARIATHEAKEQAEEELRRGPVLVTPRSAVDD